MCQERWIARTRGDLQNKSKEGGTVWLQVGFGDPQAQSLSVNSQNLHYQHQWKCLISILYNREQISLLYAILGYMPYFLMENEMLILTVWLA